MSEELTKQELELIRKSEAIDAEFKCRLMEQNDKDSGLSELLLGLGK